MNVVMMVGEIAVMEEKEENKSTQAIFRMTNELILLRVDADFVCL